MKTLSCFASCLLCCFASCLEASEVQNSNHAFTSITSAEILKTNVDDLHACPRCRRAVPPGPRKRPVN